MRKDKKEIQTGLSANLDIKTEIPSATSARFINAISDLASPATESLGIIGDYIRDIRLSRALKSTEKVKRLIDKHNIKITGAPLKFLIPWIEGISIEDDNSDITELWENLILSASIEYKSYHAKFINIIKIIGPNEASLLKKMILREHIRESDVSIFSGRQLVNSVDSYETIFPSFKDINPRIDNKNIWNYIYNQYDKSQLPRYYLIGCGITKPNDVSSKSYYYYNESLEESIALDMLKRESLIDIYNHKYILSESEIKKEIIMVISKISSLGYAFYCECINKKLS